MNKEIIKSNIEGFELTIEMCNLVLRNQEKLNEFARQAVELKEQTREFIRIEKKRLEKYKK